MIASIPSVQSAHDFFMDAGFVFGVVPMYLNFATRIVTYILVICSRVLFARHVDIFSSPRIYFLASLLSCD
jgi:hypothetical protein